MPNSYSILWIVIPFAILFAIVMRLFSGKLDKDYVRK